MRQQAEIALLVSTFQRPQHLRKCLLSIALQRGVQGLIELVVTDDGSQDETFGIVAEFAAGADFPVKLVTHRHDGFQLARTRNEGVLASSAPYLLFLDGDCVLPPDHVRQHLLRRRRGLVRAGDCVRLSAADSRQVDDQVIRRGNFRPWAPRRELRRLAKQRFKAALYRTIRHPAKPKLVGNNAGIWRDDYQRVNGYDERYVGWGCEDDDLRLRLRKAGVGIASILKWTRLYHLWHPPVPSCPRSWREGGNVSYLRGSAERSPVCQHGLFNLSEQSATELSATRLVDFDQPPDRQFAELLFEGGQGQFSGKASLNVFVARNAPPTNVPAAANAIIRAAEVFGLGELLSCRRDLSLADSCKQAGARPLVA